MTQHDKQPQPATPAKPKESGSRQQTHPGQSSHTGSPAVDNEMTRRGGAGQGARPPDQK